MPSPLFQRTPDFLASMTGRTCRSASIASPAEIDGCNLDALVAEFPADLLACYGIDGALVRRQLSAGEAACGRRCPAGQYLVAGLCIGMAQPVHGAKAGRLALAVIDMALLDVAPMRRDQRAGAGKGVGLVQHGALFGRGDRNRPFPAAFAPGALERCGRRDRHRPAET